jgi:hypothetical protein
MAKNSIGSSYKRAKGGFARKEKTAARVHQAKDTTLSIARTEAGLQKKV